MKQVVELIVLGLGATQLSQCLAPLLIVTERICSADYLYIMQAGPKVRRADMYITYLFYKTLATSVSLCLYNT